MHQKIKLSIIFGSLPSLIIILKAFTYQIQIGFVQFVNVLDLFVQFPFLCIMFYYIDKSVKEKKSNIKNNLISINTSILGYISIIIFSLGYGMHLTANAIDVYIYRVKAYREELPQDLIRYIHFYDEFIGHLILFLGLLGLFWTLTIKEINNVKVNKEDSKLEEVFCVILGGGLGGGLGIYFIEATYFIQAMMVYSSIAFLGLLWFIQKNEIKMKSIYYTKILLCAHISIIITGIIYYVIFGSFIQPSIIFGF